MNNWRVIAWIAVAMSPLAVSKADDIASCFEESVTYDNSALMKVDTKVETAEACQALCGDGCAGFTCIDEESPFLAQVCALFSSSETTMACENCVSGPKECSCEFAGECAMTETNFVDVIHSVDTAAGCAGLCNIFDSSNCSHFTFYNASSDFPQLCFLYDACQVSTDCVGCVQGPAVCNFCTFQDTKNGLCGI